MGSKRKYCQKQIVAQKALRIHQRSTADHNGGTPKLKGNTTDVEKFVYDNPQFSSDSELEGKNSKPLFSGIIFQPKFDIIIIMINLN